MASVHGDTRSNVLASYAPLGEGPERPGDVVGEGTPLATAAPREAGDVDVEALARELAGAVV
ncbi:MAG TPA: hypothetical protein VNU66_00600, partial [Mycobacteriales bacterium]|nr:hypothetical protein [Mycobacteriales bacterium]